MAIVAVAGAVATLGAGGVASAATTSLTATLKGSVEVPKAGNGTGTAKITLNPKTGRVCYTMTLQNVNSPVAAHIHVGKAGVAGPVLVPLFTAPPTSSSLKGCVPAKKKVVRAIIKHPRRYYVNVHTAEFQAGAARGQLHR